MSHKPQAQRAAQKRQPVEYVDAYVESLMRSLDGWEEVADGVQESDFNQGASDGRNTED